MRIGQFIVFGVQYDMSSDAQIFRQVIFIRHAQYRKSPEGLTQLGRKQAKLTAQATKNLNASKLYCSTMPRAKEMANLIAKSTHLKVKARSFFCEGRLPGAIDFRKNFLEKVSRPEKEKVKKQMRAANLRAERAFNFIFKPPRMGQSCELVVAHGNVIRFWVCKALKINSKKWRFLGISHASITTIQIDQHGNFILLGFSDCGHIPFKMRTWN